LTHLLVGGADTLGSDGCYLNDPQLIRASISRQLITHAPATTWLRWSHEFRAVNVAANAPEGMREVHTAAPRGRRAVTQSSVAGHFLASVVASRRHTIAAGAVAACSSLGLGCDCSGERLQ
jgi:hypothetical protein